MSEQPRRRRRQIETEVVPIADISETVQEEAFVSERENPVVPEPEVIKKTSKQYPSMSVQKEQKEKRIRVAWLAAVGVYVIADVVDVCMNSNFTFYILCASLAISVLAVLPIAAVFVFDSKEKRIPAIISAVVVFVLEVILYVKRISATPDFVEISVGARIIIALFSLPNVVSSAALLVFAAKKKKKHRVWTVIGTIILL